MRAVTRSVYGTPDVLRIDEVEKPELSDDGVLVRVRAASLNRADWYGLLGRPAFMRPMMGGLRRPKERLLGTDFAGVAEAVGKDVADVQVGDEVFGGRTGAFAEYVCARQAVRKPANVTFEEAASVPVAALTALQGARDYGKLRRGEAVLVNGASGGVGVYAVQIAKALGAGRVTAVCSTRNVELARSLGADRVIDYTHEDFTRSGERYDVVLDIAGSKPWRALRRVLQPDARVVMIGAPMTSPLLGPLGHLAATWLAARGRGRKALFFVAKFDRADLTVLADLIEAGKVRPVVERSYPLDDVAEAMRAMGAGHVQSKLVLTV